jgi:hypothetical protein
MGAVPAGWDRWGDLYLANSVIAHFMADNSTNGGSTDSSESVEAR